jgi:hypothetical protein
VAIPVVVAANLVPTSFLLVWSISRWSSGRPAHVSPGPTARLRPIRLAYEPAQLVFQLRPPHRKILAHLDKIGSLHHHNHKVMLDY